MSEQPNPKQKKPKTPKQKIKLTISRPDGRTSNASIADGHLTPVMMTVAEELLRTMCSPTELPSHGLTIEQEHRLRELALLVTAGDLRRPWSVQDSNSFRRLGTDRGDGDVLCAVTQPSDGHPDLRAAPGVLDYLVAAHPFAVIGLLEQRDRARHALDYLRHKIEGHDTAFAEAMTMSVGR